jgi:hypothetical protein
LEFSFDSRLYAGKVIDDNNYKCTNNIDEYDNRADDKALVVVVHKLWEIAFADNVQQAPGNNEHGDLCVFCVTFVEWVVMVGHLHTPLYFNRGFAARIDREEDCHGPPVIAHRVLQIYSIELIIYTEFLSFL